MRILHVDTGRGWRGGQQQVLWLMQGLRERGLEQSLLAVAGSPLAERVRREGLPTADLSLPPLSLSNLRKLRHHAGEFDLLHAHDSHGHSLAWLAGMGRGRKRRPLLVVSRRVGFPIGIFGRPKYAAADAYIAVSDFVRQQLLDAKVPAGKIRVIHDGVMPPAGPVPSGERAEFRRRQGLDEQVFLLGTLTSLAPEKLLEEEIDLLAELPYPVHLWLGWPEAEPSRQSAKTALREYARRRGLERRFQILSLPENVQPFLTALDLFLYLSQSEGLGSAILLAMAHGLPVVASNVGGIPEIVRHQQTGLLVSGNPKRELPAAIQFLMGSRDTRQRLGSAGRKFVLAHATSDIMVSKTAALYEELFQGSNLRSQ